jgi:hypothetical protein
MAIKKKIVHADNFAVHLYKEGTFWTAYEQSAFAVQQMQPEYNVNKKYEKSINELVISLDVPEDKLESVLSAFEVVRKSNSCVNLRAREAIDLSAFKVWKVFLPTTVVRPSFPDKYELEEQEEVRRAPRVIRKPSARKKRELLDLDTTESLPDNLNNGEMPESVTNENVNAIIQKLRTLDVSNISPMEALMLLSEIKRELAVSATP